MAISIKSSLNGFAAIKQIDIDDELYDWLHFSGFQVKLTATQFEFHNPEMELGKTVIYTVPVKMTQLHQLQNGTLPKAEKDELCTEITKAITLLKEHVVQPKAGGPQSALAMLAKGTGAAIMPASEKATPAWPAFDMKHLTTATLVPLAEATKMYQPVRGTSTGSRYYLVAANPNLRVAARWQASNGGLSIRIAGDGFGKHSTEINDAGFDHKGDYASLHLTCGTEVIARKALGAVIAGLGMAMDTPLPDLKIIADK